MSDKVPYHAYEKRGKMIGERDKRIAALEAENKLLTEQRDWHQSDNALRDIAIEKLNKDNERLRAALQTLAWQHGWGPNGKCVCEAHCKVEELGIHYEVPPRRENKDCSVHGMFSREDICDECRALREDEK